MFLSKFTKITSDFPFQNNKYIMMWITIVKRKIIYNLKIICSAKYTFAFPVDITDNCLNKHKIVPPA